MSVVLTRRLLLALLAGAALSSPAVPTFARDGGGDGEGEGGDDGGHDDGGNDDGGGDDSGGDDSGGDDGGGDDGGGGDDKGGDDKGDDDGGDGNHSNKAANELSQDEALKEREKGRVIPLETALRVANAKVRGRVIDVDLAMWAGRPQYRVKIRRNDGVIKTVRLDARTGRVLGFLGF